MTRIPSPLPPTSAITAAPHRILPRALHRSLNDLPRPHTDATALADAILAGRVTVDAIGIPWRPLVDGDLVDRVLAEDGDRREGPEHRLLKLHARIVALTIDPRFQLEPETAVTDERHALRADLVAWSVYGISQSFECGVADGRGVLTQLMHGQVRVNVLPYAGLQLPSIAGYSFRLADNPALPELCPDGAALAWSRILRRACRPTPDLPVPAP
ncbi:MAG: hypothetical protein HQL38_05420 [Alphaproteobacteria bacterium]|nr:hypothetical protein [Alphaproteobacteria bacterium]